jgi:hypothetical protein
MDSSIKKEEKSNNIFFIIFFILILVTIGFTFYKIVILKNYQIVKQVSCNPIIEKCFITECDPSTDDTCSASSTISYYKKISKQASSIYACENTIEQNGCKDELSCISGEKNCSYTFCNKDSLEDGEKCAE